MEHKNLWAPWRIGYIQGLSGDTRTQKKQGTSEQSGCFICDNQANPQDDDKNLVLWRSAQSLVMLNRFPYNNGHLLIAPARHIADFDSADEAEMLEIIKLIRDSQKALSLAIAPHGFNVGMNFGRCAGAGLPGHLHVHLVPRWDGDTNFMPVCSDTGVISQSMSELFDLLKKVSKEHNLPRL
ncbi:MAG TPA: HIT domain-containing protein [Sedimentisphaerales bacterium]|nr:HIT domain-containing protein [Sedimentisphaerales bacterium]